jgi:hypothetical protein
MEQPYIPQTYPIGNYQDMAARLQTGNLNQWVSKL